MVIGVSICATNRNCSCGWADLRINRYGKAERGTEKPKEESDETECEDIFR